MKNKKKNLKEIGFISKFVFVIIPVLIFFITVNNHPEGPFNIVHGVSTTNITQEINNISPIDNSDIVTAYNGVYDSTSDYILKFPLDKSNELEKYEPLSVYSPVNTFVGQVTIPYSTVILSIDYGVYFVSVVSDSHGYWSWTNYGQPFDLGEHIVTIYSISTAETDTKDVLVDQYKFYIQGLEIKNPPPELRFTEEGRTDQVINDFLIDVFDSEGSESYIFIEEFKGSANEYVAGASLEILMFLYPLKDAASHDILFNYELYPANNLQAEPILTFNEQITTQSIAFIKKINLNKDATKGSYILKTEANIDEHKYIQNINFDIVDDKITSITGEIINEGNKQQAIIWNIVFSLFIILIVLIVAISEFRNFLVSQPIDEDTLHKHDLFK